MRIDRRSQADFASVSSRLSISSCSDDSFADTVIKPTMPDAFKTEGLIGRQVNVGSDSVISQDALFEEGGEVGAPNMVRPYSDEFDIYVGMHAQRVCGRSQLTLDVTLRFFHSQYPAG